MRTPHSSCRQGKRVKVTLRDGEVHIGKFVEKKGGRIIISKRGNESTIGQRVLFGFHMSEVRAFSIYKPTV